MTKKRPAPVPLLDAAHQRTTEVVFKLRKAMATIEREIEQHEGIYPFNKGRLNQAEVCRRADVRNVTLQGYLHKHTTKVEVDDWLTTAKLGIAKGRKNVRKAVTERATAWKTDLEAIAQAYHEDQLELISLKQRLAEVTAERDELRTQVGTQLTLIRGGKGQPGNPNS